ncbi:MAG: hypothetical protein R2710_23065 [Acidimicrobiales bacterium]
MVLLDADGSSARYRANRFPRIHLVWIGGVGRLGLVGARSRRRLRASSWFTVDPSPSAVSVGEGAAATGGAVG